LLDGMVWRFGFSCSRAAYEASVSVWSIINPDWYWQRRKEAGAGSLLEAAAQGRDLRSFVPSLLIAKGSLIAVIAIMAWYVGIRAGYFSN
jgi:hypothetical protein